MNKKLCVYTCITGDYDNLHEVSCPEKGIDFYCFTNNKNLKSDTWKIIYIKNNRLDNHHLSRKIKMLGHPIINKKYDISVWMDASIIWEKSVQDFVSTYLKDSPFAAFKHSQRQTIKDEAIACLRLNKDTKDNITRTLSFLESEHFPDDQGLYEMTVFIKRHNDPTVIKTMRLWFEMNQKYSKRDQLTFMYCAWKTNLQVRTINLDVWNNKYFTHQIHNNYPPTHQCSIYYGSPNETFDYNKFYTYQYTITNHLHSVNVIIPNDTNTMEIIFASTPGIIVDNFTFKNNPTHISFLNHTRHNNQDLFLNPHSIVIIRGNFKKNHSFSFSFNLTYMDKTDLIKTIETLLQEKAQLSNRSPELEKNLKDLLLEKQKILNDNQKLLAENKRLNQELSATDLELKNILNSKAWKLICKARKTLYGKRKTT